MASRTRSRLDSKHSRHGCLEKAAGFATGGLRYFGSRQPAKATKGNQVRTPLSPEVKLAQAARQGALAVCAKCGERGYVMPLHGERGGPLFCFMCAGAWHAEHGPRRRVRRVLIKALKAYEAAGGEIYRKDFDELKLASSGFSVRAGDKDAADRDDFADLTSELLAATIALTHPDKHPTERKAEASRVTQELLALKPFVFPAPEPEPPPKPGDASLKGRGDDLNKPSQPDYPCEDCRDTISDFYCDPCKAQWEKEQQKEREREEKERVKKTSASASSTKDASNFMASSRSRRTA
jgi:hypothetical protein